MAESLPEQIYEAVEAALAPLVGDGGTTYWYSTARAMRATVLSEECLDESLATGTIYVVIPGDPEQKRAATMGAQATRKRFGVLSLDIAALQRFTPASENPYTATTPIRHTIQNRMARDAEKALCADTDLAALILRIDVTSVDTSADATGLVGWAVAWLHVEIEYQYTEAAP